VIRRYLVKGAFTATTNESEFWQAVRAEIPNLPEIGENGDLAAPPPTLVALDVIEFCWRLIEKPVHTEEPDPLEFRFFPDPGPVSQGRKEFCATVNRILRRNGLVYELRDNGYIERLVPPVWQRALAVTQFRSGDEQLDQMVEWAIQKFVDPDEEVRREALKDLWDAWERLKSIGTGSNKREQTKSILDEAAGSVSPNFREELDREAATLTRIGNTYQIRHSEITQERLARTVHADYFFFRLFAFIHMILRRPS